MESNKFSKGDYVSISCGQTQHSGIIQDVKPGIFPGSVSYQIDNQWYLDPTIRMILSKESYKSKSEFEDYLKRQGFEVNLLGGRSPFQIEAKHKSGIYIYFRSRGKNLASLEVFDNFTPGSKALFPDYLDNDILYETELASIEGYYPGDIDFNEAFYIFYYLWNDAKDLVLE